MDGEWCVVRDSTQSSKAKCVHPMVTRGRSVAGWWVVRDSNNTRWSSGILTIPGGCKYSVSPDPTYITSMRTARGLYVAVVGRPGFRRYTLPFNKLTKFCC